HIRGGLLGDGRRPQSPARTTATERLRDRPCPRDAAPVSPMGVAALPRRHDALRLPLLRARAGCALRRSAETRPGARAAALAARAGAVARVFPEAAASADALAAHHALLRRLGRPRACGRPGGRRVGASVAPRVVLGLRRRAG